MAEKESGGAVPSRKDKTRGVASKLLLVAGVLFLVIYAVKSIPPPKPETQETSSLESRVSQSDAESSGTSSPDGEPVAYPVGEMLLTAEREAYADGDMLLTIPRLGLKDAPVLSGDSFSILANGIGLYDYSCLPGEAENANVSIIAHRDIDGKEFYYIDTMTSGDLIYLEYKGVRYTYEYSGTTIIKPNNLAIVPCSDTAKVTLVSCHPIGTTLKRIIVTGELISSESVG